MMGPRQVDQAALFYEFSLERYVTATHLLRSIDRFVNLSATIKARRALMVATRWTQRWCNRPDGQHRCWWVDRASVLRCGRKFRERQCPG
jgi:hypothetical protein